MTTKPYEVSNFYAGRFPIRLLARLSCALAIPICATILSSPVTAQSAPPPADTKNEDPANTENNRASDPEEIYGSVETLIVTGLPGITRNIRDLKIDTDGVLDTLTNKEIELANDFTLSEAAVRIPGVYGVAFNGQPRFISLRGFDARYNSTDLDGNPIWNSSENNRGTQLDLLPSSAINQIDVIKALTPDIDANSIGGHLSVRTLRAFDGGTQPYVKARGELALFDQDNSRDSYRTDAVGKFTFDGGNMGAVFGVDLQRRNFYQDVFDLRDGLKLFTNSAGAVVEIPERGTWRFDRQDVSERNESYFAKLEKRQSDEFYSFVTVNYYRVADAVQNNRRRAFVDTKDKRVSDAEQGRGKASGGTNAYQISDFTRDIDTWLFAGGFDYRLDADSLIKARASWSRVRLEEDFYSSGQFQDATDASYLTTREFDITGPSGTFYLPDVNASTDPTLYSYSKSTYEEDTALDDDLYSVRVDYDHNTYAESLGFGARAGLWYRRLDRTHDRTVRQIGLPKTVSYNLADNRPDLTRVDFQDPSFSINRQSLHKLLSEKGVDTAGDVENLGADYNLQEDVYATYVMGLYATEQWRVIGGLRIEQTDIGDHIYRALNDVVTPDFFTRSYSETLPYALVSYAPRENIRIRAAFTQTMARPDFEAFAFGTSVTSDGLSRTTITGNPDLGPRLADNYDLSAEYYFSSLDGYVAVGVFKKDLSNEHFAQTTVVDNPADPTGQAKFRTTTYSGNGTATLQGIETSFAINRFDQLPAPFDGLGLLANYTYLDGEWNVLLDDGTRRTIDGLRNQPKQMLNLTGIFNYGPTTTSLAYNWSDEAFTGEFQSRPSYSAEPSLNDVFIAPFGTLDAKFSYEMPSGITFTVAAKNITDEAYEKKTGTRRDLAAGQSKFGRSFYAGLRIKY